MSFFVCINYTVLLERACWLLCIAVTSTASANIWPPQVVLVQSRVLLTGWGVAHKETGGEGRIEGPWSLFLSISTTSDPARAGHQTLAAKATATHPSSANLEALAMLLLEEYVPSMYLERALLKAPSSAVWTQMCFRAQELSWSISLKVHYRLSTENAKGQKRNCCFQSS